MWLHTARHRGAAAALEACPLGTSQRVFLLLSHATCTPLFLCLLPRPAGARAWGGQPRDLMGAAQAVCGVRGVIPLLQPPVQEALVGLAAAMVEHQAQPERLAEGAPIVRASFGLPVVLPLGRMRHEQNSGARLLAAVAGSLAARLQAAGQQAQRETAGEAMHQVALVHMVLMAAVIKDASTADAAGRPAHPVLLQAVVGALPHVLAALHRLGDLVDAAAAAAGAGDGGVGGGSSGGLEAPADPNSFIGATQRLQLLRRMLCVDGPAGNAWQQCRHPLRCSTASRSE